MSQHRIKIRAQKRVRGAKYWVAVGTLAAYTTIGGKSVPHAFAQQPTSNSGGQLPSRTKGTAVLRFDIAPGELGDVVGLYTSKTEITVLIPRDDLRAVWSPGVTGLYTPERALEKLLVGTGLSYRSTGPKQIALSIAGPVTAVEVIATAPLEGLTKYSEPMVETPQSIAVIPQEVMQEQNATTLRDTLRNVAGISIAAGEGGAQGDNLTIRGFTARNDIFLDGMRDFGSYYRDPFVFEQVQVLEGPSSVTFGRGSTGGVVNQVTKTPTTAKSFTGTLNLGSDLTRRATVDWDRPLPSLGKGASFRLNAMGHDAKVAERDIAESRRAGLAPSLAFGLATPTTFKIGYLGEWADDTPDYGVPWYFDEPAPVDRQNYYGFRHGSFLKTKVNMGTASLEHEVNGNLHVRSQFRYAHYTRDARITEARIPAPPQVVTPETPLDEISVARNQIAVNSTETFLQSQTDVIFTVKTGPIRNDVVAGFEAGRETSAPTRFNFANVLPTSLLNPDTSQPFTGESSIRTIVSGKSSTLGAYALDTVRLGQHLDVMGGVRVDRFDAKYAQFFPESDPLSHVDVMPSWRAAIVYKPTSSGSVYFDYGNSFNPSAETLSLSLGNVNLDPEENKTYEVGTKWELYSGKLSIRGSVFRTEKDNARETNPADATEIVLAGKQRVNGIEVSGGARITNRWRLQAGYAYLDSKVVRSLFFPDAVGAQLANVPKNSFTFWTNYDFPWRLSIGGGGQYIDSRTASSTVPTDPTTRQVKKAPSYVVFNAMASYPVAEHVSLQVNAYNLANAYYYDQLHPGHVVPGAGRSLLAGVTFKF